MRESNRHVLQGSSEQETLKTSIDVGKGKLNCERIQIKLLHSVYARMREKKRILRENSHVGERVKGRKEKNSLESGTKFLRMNSFFGILINSL